MTQPYYVLEIRDANGAAETHDISDEKRMLGRSKVKADLQMADKKASGRHAELRFADGVLTVTDLGSTNGTFFEGVRQTAVFTLMPGQAFKVGDSHIRLMAIHGLEPQDDARTVVGAPAWLDEVRQTEDSTRALDAVELAGLIEKDAQEKRAAVEPAAPVVQPAPVPQPEMVVPLVEPEPEIAPVDEGFGDAPDRTRALPIDEMPGLLSKEEVNRRDAVSAPVGYPEEPAQPAGFEEYYAPPSVDQDDLTPPPTASPMGAVGPVSVQFNASGMDLLKGLILHMLLIPVTLFIYFPWFAVKARKFIYAHTTIVGTPRGRATLEFNGSGGQLFVIGLHALLIPLTLYIYTPWFMLKLLRFTLDNTVARTEDGTEYQLQCTLQGGPLLKFFLLHMLLNLITLNLYTPWLICKMGKLFAANTQLVSDRRPVATFDFHGKGGQLFGMWLLGMFLTIITLGIYYFWFQAKLLKWGQKATEVKAGNARWRGDFAGEGGANFKINILFFLLYSLTLGIYYFWYKVDALKWRLNNSSLKVFRP
ncbi:MAG: uncharacterized membrane protein YjgN (DUF898 family) [Myxococcota bacterium]